MKMPETWVTGLPACGAGKMPYGDRHPHTTAALNRARGTSERLAGNAGNALP